MKKITFITLTLTVLIFSQCKKDKEPCVINIPDWCHLVDLTDENDPVCGCDGKTYQNASYASCVGGVASYKKGKCK